MKTADRSTAAPWPPVIPASRAPWPLRVRDALLTLVAWAVFAWLMRNALLVAVYAVAPDVAVAAMAWFNDHLAPWFGEIDIPAPAQFWKDFSGYAVLVALFMGWICVWAGFNRRLLARRVPGAGELLGSQYAQPAALLPHTRSADVEKTEAWRALRRAPRRLLVAFDDAGAVERVVADDDTLR